MHHFQKYITSSYWMQIISLVVIALIIHAGVLKFIFPGYYSPLYPHHSDFYISVALAHSPGDFFQYRYLGYARPVGLFFLKIIGQLGLHGAILFTVINVALNCSLSAMLFRRVLGITFGWPFILSFCIYCLQLFSQAYFYTFYTQDVFSHLSYLLLLTGAILFYRLHVKHQLAAYALLFILSVTAFLCKETYVLTALFVAFGWLIFNWKKQPRLALLPLLTLGAGLLLVLVFNLIIKSVFINFQNNAVTDPYYVNGSIQSVSHEMKKYLGEGLNVMNWFMILAVVFIGILYMRNNDKKTGYLLTGCIIGSFLSWIPNTLIPNHHHGGYSFNGAYLLYLPLLSVPAIAKRNMLFMSWGIAVFIACLVSPSLNSKEYARQSWSLEQESTERNLLHSLDTLMGGLHPTAGDQGILITGLTMPFYPFHHPLSLKEYPNSKYASYDVVNYTMTTPGKRDNLVRFIRPLDIKMDDYSAVWLFAGNGRTLRKLTLTAAIRDSLTNKNNLNLVIFPDSAKNQRLTFIIK